MKTKRSAKQSATPPGSLQQHGSAAIEPSEIALVIMLGICKVALVWWFDWRLGAAWACHVLMEDFRKDFKKRKQQNAAHERPATSD